MAPLPIGVTIIATLFFVGSFLAATHDMAIDGYYMEALDKEGQARFVGYRVMAYRISMMTGAGIIVTIGTMVSWRMGYFSAAILLGILFMPAWTARTAKPRVSITKPTALKPVAIQPIPLLGLRR